MDGIRTLPLSEARRRQYTARRRTLNYGSIYDFTHLESTAAPPIPPLLGVRMSVMKRAGIGSTWPG